MAKGPQILTANRLRDGEVVYWRQGGWVGDFCEAELLSEDASAKAALAAADTFVRDRFAVNPYLFEVRAADFSPLEQRERIRAAGPSVRRDLGKQVRHVPV